LSQDELSQVKQDMERLAADVKGLLALDDKACCTRKEGDIACHSKCGNHGRMWMYLGLTALAAGLAGALIAKK
jgi:hypothetical protein